MPDERNIVGPQIRRIRDQKNWSQEDFAAACQRAGWDVSRGVIARIEGCVRWVADFELLEIARVLGVSVPELYPPNKQRYFVKKK